MLMMIMGWDVAVVRGCDLWERQELTPRDDAKGVGKMEERLWQGRKTLQERTRVGNMTQSE